MARSKALTCEKCAVPTRINSENRRIHGYKPKMKRLYIKHRGCWLRVGWVCLSCNNMVMDSGLKQEIEARKREFDLFKTILS